MKLDKNEKELPASFGCGEWRSVQWEIGLHKSI